jgi:hypothetical protein
MLVLRPESMIFFAFLLIIVMFTLIQLNQEARLEDFSRRMIHFYEGTELENDIMRWLLAHPKEPISANVLGKELSRPVDHVRSALERLCIAETLAVARAKDEVVEPVANSSSNSSRQVENVSCEPDIGESRVN